MPVYEPNLSFLVRITRDGMDAFQGPADPAQRYLGLSGQQTTVKERLPNLRFTTDSVAAIAEADMIFVSVNTPTKSKGIGAGMATDTSALDAVITLVAAHSKDGVIIVEKSTVPSHTVDMISSTVRLALHYCQVRAAD